MRRMTVALATWGLVAGSCLLTTPSQAQNLLTNPGFTTDLTGWDMYNPGHGILLWSTMDAGGSPGSGSASIGNTSTGIESFGLSQCVPVVEFERYRFGTRYYVTSGQNAPGDAWVAIGWWEGPGCTGNNPEGAGAPAVDEFDTWDLSVNPDVEALANAQSAQVLLLVRKYQPSGLRSAFADNAFFEPIHPIFEDGFEMGDTSRWSATVQK